MTETAIGYIRVSTQDQNNGIDAQLAAIKAFAASRHIAMTRWFVDRCSGATPVDERPELLSAIREVAGHDYLLAHRRDRLARDVIVAATLEKLVSDVGAVVLTTDAAAAADTPEGRLMRTVIDAMAQYERAIIRARIKSALAVLKKRGVKLGQVQFIGTRRGQEVFALATAMRVRGLSGREIAEQLNRQGYKTAMDRSWNERSAKSLLKAGKKQGCGNVGR